jgi:hypothetical protein
MGEENLDVLVWRKDIAQINQAKSSIARRGHIIGFAITREDSRFDVFDRRGAFLATTTREQPPVIAARIDTDPAACVAAAKTFLKHPFKLAEMHLYAGAAVNPQANYIAIRARLLEGKDHEFHLIGTSRAATGGEDAVFMDPVTAPLAMQNTFLDHMHQLQTGDPIEWKKYDQEMLRAAQTYRADSFCDWLLQASGSKLERTEVARRLALLDSKSSHRLMSESMCVLLPEMLFYTAEDLGRPEELDHEAVIDLPESALRILA